MILQLAGCMLLSQNLATNHIRWRMAVYYGLNTYAALLGGLLLCDLSIPRYDPAVMTRLINRAKDTPSYFKYEKLYRLKEELENELGVSADELPEPHYVHIH
jgi:hypothetical protein